MLCTPLPQSDATAEFGGVGLQVIGVDRCIVGIQPGETPRDQPCYPRAVPGIEQVVRIALRMNITHRSIDGPLRLLQDWQISRSRVEMAHCTDGHSGIPGTPYQEWQPADLEFEARIDQEVGTVEPTHKTRFGLYGVRILVTARDRLDFDKVSADGTCDRCKIGCRSDDPEIGSSRAEDQDGCEASDEMDRESSCVSGMRSSARHYVMEVVTSRHEQDVIRL